MSEQENWDLEREQLEKKISDAISGRAREQGWFNAKGRLSGKGQKAALEMVIGMAAGLEAVDHPRKQWMLSQAFLCSVRGVEGRFQLEAA